MPRSARVDLLPILLSSLSLTATPAASAAPPDLCNRQIEGASLEMSFDAIKTEWTKRGYQDVTQVARGAPRGTTLTFVKNGGANLQTPGGKTLTWKSSALAISLSYQETGPARSASTLGLFQARYAEFCPDGEVRTPELLCMKAVPGQIDVAGPLMPGNQQCSYSVNLSGPMRVSQFTEGVQKADKTLAVDKMETVRQLMQGKKPAPTAP